MKKSLFYVLIILVTLSISNIYSQVKTNVAELIQLSERFNAENQLKIERVKAYAKKNGVKIFQDLGNGKARQIVDVVNGLPVYYITHNLGAAITTRASELWPGGSTGLGISGEGYTQVGEWDAGKVRTTHQEFTDQGTSRILVMDGNHALHDHATHVAGTIIAAGVNSGAKGMGYAGTLKTWEWSNDESEMAAAAANGLEISNHSYGYVRGWSYNNGNWVWHGNSNVSPDEDYRFGFYDGDSRKLDQIAYNAPNYLIVKSAGNDRGEGPGDAGTNGKAEKDGGDDGFDCIGTTGVSKNILTVGAVKEVLNYTKPEDVQMSSFSCWGPADDGRIKPDIVAKGVDVFSTTAASNSSYASYNGTSMSSPNATGTMALLQKYYQDTHGGVPMRSATLKALVIHTADEAGPHPGPDYMFGWGLMNAKKASQIITDDMGQNIIDEQVLNNGDSYTKEVYVPGTAQLRVTICWTDPAALPVSAQLNPRDPMLVNDLDLAVQDPSGNIYYPWRLDPDNPSAPAANDDKNNVDNVELVQVDNPAPGTYTIVVDHKGTLTNGLQAFSIIISGTDDYNVLPECVNNLVSPANGDTGVLLNAAITWEPANFASSYDIYFGTDGDGITTPSNYYNGVNVASNGFVPYMAASTTYYLQIVPRNNMGTAENCSEIYSFTTMPAVENYPYLVDVENVFTPDLPYGWQQYNLLEMSWFSTNLIGNSGNQSIAIYNTDGLVETDYDNWFISAPLRLTEGNEYNATFYYKSFIPGHNESMSVYWGNSPFVEDMTNLLYEAVNFNAAAWTKGEGLIIPMENDSVVFIGYHIVSAGGYGMFLDDMQLENWGTVGLKEEKGYDQVKIFNKNGKLAIEAGIDWSGSDVAVYDLTGKKVYEGKLGKNMLINIRNKTATLFIVNLQKGNSRFTKKVVIP